MMVAPKVSMFSIAVKIGKHSILQAKFVFLVSFQEEVELLNLL